MAKLRVCLSLSESYSLHLQEERVLGGLQHELSMYVHKQWTKPIHAGLCTMLDLPKVELQVYARSCWQLLWHFKVDL